MNCAAVTGWLEQRKFGEEAQRESQWSNSGPEENSRLSVPQKPSGEGIINTGL